MTKRLQGRKTERHGVAIYTEIHIIWRVIHKDSGNKKGKQHRVGAENRKTHRRGQQTEIHMLRTKEPGKTHSRNRNVKDTWWG